MRIIGYRDYYFRFWDKSKKQMIYKDLSKCNFEHEDLIVMQYTGFYTNDMIYEGDLISYNGKSVRVVLWNDDFSCWTCSQDIKLNYKVELFHWYQMKKKESKFYRKIGNIFENENAIAGINYEKKREFFLKITIPTTGHMIEVANNDLPYMMRLRDAYYNSNELGNGWRLPTKEEIIQMNIQLHENGKGNFNIKNPYCFDFMGNNTYDADLLIHEWSYFFGPTWDFSSSDFWSSISDFYTVRVVRDYIEDDIITIDNPITKRKLEVAKEDLPDKINWYEAMGRCIEIGSGWRLPTNREFDVMCDQLHRFDEGNFKRGSKYKYLTSSENRQSGNLICYCFGYIDNGYEVNSEWKDSKGYVRLVRDL